MDVIWHADDFGMNLGQSRRMLSYSTRCGGDGALSSVSVMVNGPDARACAEILRPQLAGGDGADGDGLLASLHVNLVEGPACAAAAEVPLLAGPDGMLRLGFGDMLARSIGPGSRELERQLEIEIGAQLDRYLEFFPDQRGRLRIDGHQHFHLIPAVFRALWRAIRSRGCTVAHMRLPVEPVGPLLASPGSIARVPPVNWVKTAVLHLLWAACRLTDPADAREAAGSSAVFFGIAFSGRMVAEIIKGLLPAFEDLARRRGVPLEVLFHPAGLEDGEEPLNPELEGFVAFNRSPLRRREGEELRRLGRTGAAGARSEGKGVRHGSR